MPVSVLFVVVGLAVVAATLLLRDRPPVGTEQHPVLIAVLPFERQGGGDAYLAQGLWDDTRAAISRVGATRVLGRSTTLTAVQRGLSPDEYRKRFGVEYLLEGTLRPDDQQVLVSVSLTRTSDGVAMWEDSLRARPGDPIALQEAIAGGIEGKLRGRLARGGGRRADQIPTSAEVYALYSEARALLRERESHQSRRAEALLRKALALDPNYAPAWSSLAFAIYHRGPGPIYTDADRAEIVGMLRKALAIAPNLAEAHATLANVGSGDPALVERELRRAVALDPSYAEAWNWLGITLHGSYRYREAITAFERAIEIDPLWLPPMPNLVWSANELGDRRPIDRLFKRLERARASNELIKTAQAEDLLDRGDYSGSLGALRSLGTDSEGRPAPAAFPQVIDLLFLLGYVDQAVQLTGLPEGYAEMIRSERLPPRSLNGRILSPTEFWSTIFFTPHAARAMVNLGKEAELVRLYDAAFENADELISGGDKGVPTVALAPTVSVALKAQGRSKEAEYILATAAELAEAGTRASPQARQPFADLAIIRAAQGERDKALRLLSIAVRRGWMPDGARQTLDLAQEPAYRAFRSDPRFEALRKQVIGHVQRERAELGLLTI